MLKKRMKSNECLLVNNQIREFYRKLNISEAYLDKHSHLDLIYLIKSLKKDLLNKPIKTRYELSLREKDLTIILTQAKNRLNM